MDNVTYAMLSRQSGLWKEMQTVAQNVANADTTGYRREALVFSEFVARTDDGFSSLSMGTARTHYTDYTQGPMAATGAPLDLAIEGEGFFVVETDDGARLTRAGSFSLSPEGEMVTVDGLRVLSADEAPIAIPPGAHPVRIASDGTVTAGGQVVGTVGVVTADPLTLRREAAGLFEASEGFEPSGKARVAQGFLESSNVNAVTEIARMIEVQRTYELGTKLLDRDHDRISKAIQTLGAAL